MDDWEQLGFDFGGSEIKIEKPIRMISFFAGYGSPEMALKRMGVKVEHHFVCEFDEFAIKSYNAVHGTNFPASDIRNVHGEDLKITDKDKYCYIMTYSFPCLTEDSLIFTKKGYKELKNVNVGEEVLTKSNTWHKVVKKFDNGVHPTCFVNSFGFKKMHCTLNHKFYVREMYRKYPCYENGKRGAERHFKNPEFKEVKDLTRNDYFGIPVIEEEKSFYTDDNEFWYIIGLYVGDGWLGKRGYEVSIACNDKKLEKINRRLSQDKWKYSVNDMELSCHRMRFSNKDVYEFIQKYIGTGSNNKVIPTEIINLPKEQLKAFFDGYFDSDGNINGKYMRISSINVNLIYATSMIINKLYHRPVSVNVEKPRKKEHFIDGRLIKSNYPLYELKFKISKDKQDKAFYENGYIWFPFYGIEMANNENVYNIEVEEDHSYVVNGCISKNCTDLSLAGKQKGMSRDSGTRSSLLWEVERILNELVDNKLELPDILLLENVPQVVSDKFWPDFEQWLKFLSSIGYFSRYEILNAKNYGVAQNRQRCFMLSFLGEDYKYTFPKEIPLKKRLKDYLEKEVDEKYYLNSEKAQQLIDQLIERGVLKDEDKKE